MPGPGLKLFPIDYITYNQTNMKILLFTLLFSSLFTPIVFGQQDQDIPPSKKIKILVHITQGPENPTRAALGFFSSKITFIDGLF